MIDKSFTLHRQIFQPCIGDSVVVYKHKSTQRTLEPKNFQRPRHLNLQTMKLLNANIRNLNLEIGQSTQSHSFSRTTRKKSFITEEGIQQFLQGTNMSIIIRTLMKKKKFLWTPRHNYLRLRGRNGMIDLENVK